MALVCGNASFAMKFRRRTSTGSSPVVAAILSMTRSITSAGASLPNGRAPAQGDLFVTATV